MMVYSLYCISLKLKTPSEKGKKINFKNNQEDLLEALEEFNKKYRSWSKRLILTKIEDKFFNLVLIIEKDKEKVSTREIRSFTAYLNKEKNWSVYSRETSKLFEGIKFSKITLEEAKEIITTFDSNTELFELQKENIDYLRQTQNQLTKKEISEEKSKISNQTNHDLSDEQAIAIFNYLIKTKDLGINHKEKKESILQIKDILTNWL
ncbi:hypothetical protein [Vallitalea okinawensis]|uniref:hypothetical protein n=1 Tax=Vallitalea okinawensis TaxID=2078660 RepID=UPI000CFD294F|nr:hypothetical protein [Vallitalea okinawensis]